MYKIKPMAQIMIILCMFGIFMGMIFPIYAGFFIEWIPGKRTPFILGCLIAGIIVGIFGFLMVQLILKRIDHYYKTILSDKLGISQFIKKDMEKDLLLSMQQEFEELLNQFVSMKKNEEDRLKELAITDCLTSLYNHRHFFDNLELKKTNGSDVVHILFCDLDHFKVINDIHGHVIGDLVLKEVAKDMKSIIGKDGNVFRYGGEEFVVILENCNVTQAYETAEAIRLKVSSSQILNQYGISREITISIGIASCPEHSQELDNLLDMADKAMYDAKLNGRNQCQIYGT